MKTIAIIIVTLVVFIGAGFLLYQQSYQAPTDLPGQVFEIQGQVHITQGSTDHPAYNSNPPTSGWHWPQPANWGAYDTTQADEQLVHNLEHGGIWVAYKPDLDPAQINQLKDLAKRYRKVIVEPRPANDSNIALAAWGRLQKLDQYDEGAVIRFIEAFYNKGPEKVD